MRRIKSFLVLVLTMLMLCACNNPQDAAMSVAKQMVNTPTELVIIAGDISNAPKIDFCVKEIVEIIQETCYLNGHVTIISPEGKPQTVFDKDVGNAANKTLSQVKQNQIAKAYASQIEAIFNAYVPSSEERNLLGALHKASDIFKYSSYSQKILIVIDNGIQTEGTFNLNSIRLKEGVELDICNQLKALREIPDLTNVNCFISGLGSTYLPQEDLSNAEQDTVELIWQEIITTGGGNFNMLRSAYTDVGVEGAPYVTPIGVHNEEVCIVGDDDMPKVIPQGGITLNETKLAFCPDSARFCDSEQADNELRNIAAIISENQVTVSIFGTTASTEDEQYSISLSQERAEAVREKLKEFGVEDSHISETIGLGFNNYFYIEDRDEFGNQLIEESQKNRAVHIIDCKDPLIDILN